MTLRKAEARGRTRLSWLDSRHTFSFGDYVDPGHVGFGPLLVINEDRVEPGAGFGKHSHSDMEIISYVLAGALEHEDSLGNGSVIQPGDVQRMSAGTGVTHSEFNASASQPVHFLQIWIVPEAEGGSPGYEQKRFEARELSGQLRLVGDALGSDGGVRIRQDVRMFAARLESAGTRLTYEGDPSRRLWLHVARGSLVANGNVLEAGDGAAFVDEARIDFLSAPHAELLLFDLPGTNW